MKRVEAFIRPEKLEDIKGILSTMDINGLSISQVMGCGKQKGWKEYVRGAEVDYNFVQKIKIELIVREEQVEEMISKIRDAAVTGEVGDGKIFISDVIDAVRIRTGERGINAVK
jgi:nitrogen regulatory protein P-II 1